MNINDGRVICRQDVRVEKMSGMSWVRLIHEPTGLDAECRETSNYEQNFELAWKKLETACLKEVCRRVGETARTQAFAKGHPVCYMKDGQIVYEYPDGRIVQARKT